MLGRIASALRGLRDAPDDRRWVVLDTETTGLDPETDVVLAIGAVAVDAHGIRLVDSFECVLRNDAVSGADNVLVHGIGHDAQRYGEPREAALRAFADYVDRSPCVAFHADFDRRVLERAFAVERVDAAGVAWLDLAPLASALDSQAPRKGGASLDDRLALFAIEVASRHTAAGDALATAELLLRLRAMAAQQGATTFAALAKVARQRKWLGNAG